jgi:hypothetical protein
VSPEASAAVGSSPGDSAGPQASASASPTARSRDKAVSLTAACGG